MIFVPEHFTNILFIFLNIKIVDMLLEFFGKTQYINAVIKSNSVI